MSFLDFSTRGEQSRLAYRVAAIWGAPPMAIFRPVGIWLAWHIRGETAPASSGTGGGNDDDKSYNALWSGQAVSLYPYSTPIPVP